MRHLYRGMPACLLSDSFLNAPTGRAPNRSRYSFPFNVSSAFNLKPLPLKVQILLAFSGALVGIKCAAAILQVALQQIEFYKMTGLKIFSL